MTELRNLSVGEHHLIGDIIGDSFADDPVNQWIFRSQTSIANFYRMVAKKLYLQKGYGHVMEDGSGGTLWLPPGVKKFIPVWNSVDIAASMIWHGGLYTPLRGMGVDDALADKKPTEPHYFLFAIGVRPALQGQGIGTKLMQVGLEQADSERKPAYLESSKESNIPFYNQFGFEVVEKIDPGKGCPALWLMWREAK
ncbi:GNAT family N-acetyltransferase [Candidatus Leptofilum sp.]|uniref:GNAT family N-acetyltransferase n=1 Tax=Candidatus Leptofilum sp. TaxID=3241576 RepID=UPI003B5BAB6D